VGVSGGTATRHAHLRYRRQNGGCANGAKCLVSGDLHDFGTDCAVILAELPESIIDVIEQVDYTASSESASLSRL
jgi:hypothetical protein